MDIVLVIPETKGFFLAWLEITRTHHRSEELKKEIFIVISNLAKGAKENFYCNVSPLCL